MQSNPPPLPADEPEVRRVSPHAFPHYRVWLIIGWGMVAGAFVLSLVPLPFDFPEEGGDKIGHLIAYAGLSFWFGMLYAGWPRRIAIALGFTLMGVAIEFLQRLTDYRSFEVADMAADALGTVIGIALLRTPLANALDWVERFLQWIGWRG